MRKVYIYPFSLNSNEYIENLKEIFLKNHFKILKPPKLSRLIFFQTDKSDKTIIINWLENKAVFQGKLNFIRLLKVIFYLIFLRLNRFKLIRFEHNLFPHTLKNPKLFLFIEKHILNYFFHSSISLNFAHKFENFIPHPKYKPLVRTPPKDNKILIFGRIVRYKKIEESLKLIPHTFQVMVSGIVEDEEYFQEISKKFRCKNIVFYPNPTSTALKKLLNETQYFLVNAQSKSYLNSGSAIFALSNNRYVVTDEKVIYRNIVKTCPKGILTLSELKQNNKK